MAIANRKSKIANDWDASGYGLRDNNSSGELFDTPLFAPTAPIENPPRLSQSVEVAAIISAGRRKKILQLLLNEGDLTLDEMCQMFTMGQTVCTPNQISGRISDLKREMLIVETGKERATRSGCAAQVYHITDRGRDELLRMKQTQT